MISSSSFARRVSRGSSAARHRRPQFSERLGAGKRDLSIPGDKVEAGQKIATVESATMLRSLAELAAEKARISSRMAQLNARKGVVTTLMPLAEQSVIQTEGVLNALQKAGTNGLTVSKNLQEMTSASVQASERHLSLKAEQGSLDVEAEANKKALDQVSAAYNDLQRAYNDGVLYAPVSGYIGANVAMVGQRPPKLQAVNLLCQCAVNDDMRARAPAYDMAPL